MSTVFKVIVSLIAGLVVGVAAVSAMCSIPALTFGTACGHNAGMWLFLSIPLGMGVCWLALSVIAGDRRKTNEPSAGANDA
jgi:hypothetical protein